MLPKLRILLLFLVLLPSFLLPVYGQTTSQAEEENNWALTGYLKNMKTWLFFNDFPEDAFLQDNLIHNRLSFTYYADEHWTFRADLRTRAFFGDLVRAQPSYADLIDDVNNDYFDLSVILLDRPSWVVHTMLDRLYFEYAKDNWEVRLGRQRVNWGISTIWNPNDVFNAFAFTDFDYEERPGSDALRVRYFLDYASSFEIAVKAADRIDETVIAGLWKFNKGNYDFQILTGLVQNEWVIGGGWAGNIKNAGFKGEWSYFLPFEENVNNSFALTAGIDYVFENGIYGNVGYLYNSNGSTSANIVGLFDFELSAKNLYPYRHALVLQASYPITPLLNGGAAIIYSPVDVHPLFVNPTITYSIANNWDIDMIGQIVMNDQQDGYKSPLQAVFLRLKWSF
jgi:hypothetical protein